MPQIVSFEFVPTVGTWVLALWTFASFVGCGSSAATGAADAAASASSGSAGSAAGSGASAGAGSSGSSTSSGGDASSGGEETGDSGDATTSGSGATGSGDDGGAEAAVSPGDDAAAEAAADVSSVDGAVGAEYDTGVHLGCAADPTPADPTAGWTEYSDAYPPPPGTPYPQVEYPYNLPSQTNCMTTDPISDPQSPCRFSFQNGLYTFWIFQNDQSHAPPDSGLAPTDPRSEMHWSTFTAKDAHPQRMWTGDVKVIGAPNGTPPATNTILQVHTNATGAGPVYIRVNGGMLFQLGDTKNYYKPTDGAWFNMKVAFDATTLTSTVWIDDCNVGTWDGSGYPGKGLAGGDVFYFKNGSYGCTSGECINEFANIRFYWK